MKSHMAVTVACTLTLVMAGACAQRSAQPERISTERPSQSDLGKQIVADTQQGAEQRAQVTMGGAKPFVSGEVLRIDGDNYFVRDRETGEEVKLIVNTDTNLDCGAAAGERQETATGSGFAVGGCAFRQGDQVNAEVSDTGTVRTLRLLSPEQSGQAPAHR